MIKDIKKMEKDILSNDISFSIISACYNHANFVEEAIKSVISQTYPYWELIIVDDASTDNSVEKIKPFLKDPRIKLFIHDKNKGAGRTVRDAAAKASNMIIGLFDTDDKLHEKALEIFAEAYRENPDCGLIYSTHWECDSNLNIKGTPNWVGPVDPEKTNMIKFRISHFKTFKRSIYKKTNGFNSKLILCGDLDICLKLEEYTNLKYIDIPLYYYRIHDAGVSQNRRYKLMVENYIARINAYHRRKNTNIPNRTLDSLYFLYYQLTFFKQIKFFNNLKNLIKLSKFLKISSYKFPKFYSNISFVFGLIKNKILFSKK